MKVQKAARRVGAICLKVAVLALVVLGIIYLGQTAFRYTHAVFSDAAFEEAPGKDLVLTVSEDTDAGKLADVLEKNGIIEDAAVFRIQMKVADFDETVKAGTYHLNTSMTPNEIFQVLAEESGDSEK